MPLTSTDLTAFNLAVLELHATSNASDFPKRIRRAVRRVLSGDVVVVDWINPRLPAIANPVDLSDDPSPSKVALSAPPAMAHAIEPIEVNFRKISQKEFSGLEVRFSTALKLVVSGGPSPGSPEREKLKLRLIGPHLHYIYDRFATQGEATLRYEFVRRQGYVGIDFDGRGFHWPEEILTLLEAYDLSIVDHYLPVTVREKFLEFLQAPEEADPASELVRSLRIERAPSALRIGFLHHADDFFLVLQETETISAVHLFSKFGVSPRESEVLRWAAQGKTNAEVAAILGVSVGTVKRHLENAYPKLGVENRHGAALLVMQALASLAQTAAIL